MTKALFVLAVAVAIIVGCKEVPDVKNRPTEATDWSVEVRFMDNSIDTIIVRSLKQPILRANEGMGYIDLGDSYMPAACYVKTMRILN